MNAKTPGHTAVRKALAAAAAVSLVTLLPGPAFADDAAPPTISSATTKIGDPPSNVDYSKQEEWEQVFPDGTFIVEHSEYTVREGGEDPANPQDVYLGINIARMGGRDNLSKVTFAVAALTADDADYAVEDDTVTFQPGEEEKTAYVKILDDDRAENDRFLTFTLIDAGNGHLGHLTTAMIRILDNEEYVETVFSAIPPGITDKSLSAATVTLTRDEGAAPYYATVIAKTQDGTAKSGTDYEAVEQTVVFEEGETSKDVLIPLLQTGGAQQGTVALTLELSEPKGGAIAEGSESVEVRLTDRNPDPKNPIHNSESLAEALGESDQTAEIELDRRDATENDPSVAVSENDGSVSRPQLVANALGAARGLAAVQPFAAAYWGTQEVVYDYEAGQQLFSSSTMHPAAYSSGTNWLDDLFPMNSGARFDNADQDLLILSYNTYNLNQFKEVTFDWENDAGNDLNLNHPTSHFGYTSNNLINMPAGEVKMKNNSMVGLLVRDAGYVNYDTGRANLIARTNARVSRRSDRRRLRQEENGLPPAHVRQAYLYGGVVDYKEGNDWNQFNIYSVKLTRSYIPDSTLMNGVTGATWHSRTEDGISFTKDGFIFTITPISGRGGRWWDADPERSGTYIGSRVQVTARPLDNRLLNSVGLTDIHGKNHTGISNFTLNEQGDYVGEMTWGTVNTLEPGIIDLGSNYEFNYSSLPLNWQVDSSEFAVIDMNTTNVKHLAGYQDVTTNEQLTAPAAMVFYGHQAYPTIEANGWDQNNPATYHYGAKGFTTVTVNPTNYGPKVEFWTDLPKPYDVITQETSIDFSYFRQVAGRVRFWAVDGNLETFEPDFSIGNRTVDRKGEDGWGRRVIIPLSARKLLFEDLHEKTGPPVADALTLHLSVTNTKANPAAPISEKFLIDVYRTDSQGGNDLLLFSFVHDTANEQQPVPQEGRVMELRNVNARLYSQEPGYEGSWPEVMLTEATSGYVAYQVRAPSYHNYMDELGEIPTAFQGEQRMELRAHEKDSIENIEAGVSSGVLAQASGITVRRPIPDDRLTRAAEGFSTPVQPGQEKMYIYTDNNSSMDLPSLDFDLGTLSEVFDSPVRVGPGISLDGEQITVSLTLSGTVKESKKGPQPSNMDQLKDLSKKRSTGSGFNPANTKGVSSKKGVEIGGGVSITLVYDEYQGRFVFGECMFMISGSASFGKQYPLIPVIPVAYASVGVGGGVEIASGFRQVAVGMVNGHVERRILFNGITITPSAYFSVGVGIGVADVLSVGLSAFIRGQFEGTLARTELTKGSDMLDLYRDIPQLETSGNHQFLDGQLGAHKRTLLALGTAGGGSPSGTATVMLEAKNFALRGAMHPSGARMLVRVYNMDDQLLDEQSVDTSYSTRELGCSLYKFSTGALTSLKVEIGFDDSVGAQEGKYLQLDEISFKTMDELYTTRTVPGTFGDWNVDIGIQLNIKALIFGFDLDLIYFYLNQDGFGYGYPGGQKQIGTYRGMSVAEPDPHAEVSKIERSPQDASAAQPMAMRSARGLLSAAEQSVADYFDLGDYAPNKELAELDSSVFATSRSQVVQVDNETYYFWIDDPGEQIRPDEDQRLILQYRTKSDPTIRYIDDDGTGDFDFAAEVDAEGRLRVAWTSFKQNVTVPPGLSGADELAFYLKQIEVKTAVMGAGGAFGPATVVGGTGDSRGDSMPALASNGAGVSLLAFVKDEAGRYGADVKINGELADPEAQEVIEDWANALNQGVSRPYVSLDHGSGYGSATAVDLGLDDSFWKVGTKITSLSAGFLDPSHVAMAFTAEIPNAQKGAYRGVDKLLFVQYGELDAGQLSFGNAQLVQSSFDYDAPLVDVFGEGSVPDEYQGPTSLYEQPILTQAQFKRVAVPEGSGGTASDRELTLFYKLNEQLLFIPEASLKAIGGMTGGDREIKTIDISTAEYEVGVTGDGRLYLVYSEAAESGYDAQLMFKLFNEGVWSDPVQLTRSQAFDQGAYDSYQPTGAASFNRFTSAVDALDNLELLVQTAYTPFDFTEDINGPDGQTVIVPYLNETSPRATRELYSISFGHPVKAMAGSAIETSSVIFPGGDEVDASFTVTNAGDAALSEFAVEFYAGAQLVDTAEYSGTFVPGQSLDMAFTYAVPPDVAHGTQLHYRLLSGGRELYASTVEQNYTIEANKAELEFDKYEARVNDSNEIVYNTNVANIGHRSPTRDIRVVFEAMVLDENDLMVVDTTIGADGVIYTSDPITLTSPIGFNATGQFPIPPDLTHGKFDVRARIVTDEPEYSQDNNVTVNFSLYPTASITTGFEAQSNIVDVKVGDEIILDQLAVSSSMDGVTPDSLVIHEVLEGRDEACLSFENTNGQRSIRVMRAPEPTGVTPVKVEFGIEDSTVSRALILNVSSAEPLNLTGDGAADGVQYVTPGWTPVTKTPPSPYLENDAIESDQSADQTIRFAFEGTGFELFGDKGPRGGSVKVEVFTDESWDPASSGVLERTVSLDQEVLQQSSHLTSAQLPTRQNYYVQITAMSGARVVLDYLVLEGVHADLHPSVGTNPAAGSDVDLDAPLVDGRNRMGTVSLTFTEQVAEAQVQDMSAFKLPFRIEGANGESLGTADFTYAGIAGNGKTVTFTNVALASRADQSIVRYVLDATEIPDGFLTSTSGAAVGTAIPNPSRIVFEMSESRVASAAVVDDPSLPDGNVKKAVQVTFEQPVAVERLEGTKLRYTVNGRSVDFEYAETTEQGLAVYRAHVAPQDGEDALEFAFQGGIDLREGRYALISSDGNYVDATISNVGRTLDFSYARTKVTDATIYRQVHTETQDVHETIAAQVVFDKPVTVEHLNAGELYLEADVMVQGGVQPESSVVTLPFASVSADRQTLTFESTRQLYAGERTVTVSMRSRGVETASGKFVLSADDKIPVATAFTSAIVPVTFNTAAGITGVRLSVDGGFNPTDNIPLAEVTFDSPVRPEGLAGTRLVIEETVRDEAGNLSTIPRTLLFDRLEQDPLAPPATSPPMAVFRYDNSTEPIAFAPQEVAKSFSLPAGTVIQGANGPADLLSYDGNVRIDPLIGVDTAGVVEHVKVRAATADLARTPGAGSGEGNTLTLTVGFDGDFTLNDIGGVTARLVKTQGGTTSEVLLPAKAVEGARTIVFEGTDGVYAGGVGVEYRLDGALNGLAGRAVDSAGIDVLPRVDGLGSLAIDNADAQVEAVSLSLDGISEANILPKVTVSYGVDLDAASFQGASLALEVVATAADGRETRSESSLTFDGLEGRRTASFTSTSPITDDAVHYSFAVVGTEIVGADILDEARSVQLDPTLPASENASFKRPEVIDAAFTATWNQPRELALRDVALTLTFDQPVAASGLSQLLLRGNGSVARQGAATDLGVIEFARAEAVNASTVRLWADSDVVIRDAAAVSLVLTDSVLPLLADGSPVLVDQAHPGIGVLRSLPGTEAEFPFAPREDQARLSVAGLGQRYVYGAAPVELSVEGGSGSGAVVFTSSDSTVASVSGNVATILKAGSFTITATKDSDSDYNEASATSGVVTVAQAAPVVSVSGAGVSAGQNVTLDIAVTKPEGSTGTTPAGTVTVKEGATVLGTDLPLSDGAASYAVTAPSAGDHLYTVEYSGQAGYYSSATGTQTVRVAGVGSTDQTVYRVVAHFGRWTGSGQATATIDADHTKFSHLSLRGATIDASAYTVTAGSTVITLKEAYLKTLPNGEHTFVAHFSDGNSEGITLTAAQKTNGGSGSGTGSKAKASPKALPLTGANSLPLFLLALLVLALGTTLKTKSPKRR
jgi:hypothetical protein